MLLGYCPFLFHWEQSCFGLGKGKWQKDRKLSKADQSVGEKTRDASLFMYLVLLADFGGKDERHENRHRSNSPLFL